MNATAPKSGREETLDDIVLAHWILYGVRPSAEGLSYWTERLEDRSLFEIMHTMHRSATPNRRFEWRRFYRAIGVGGAHSEKVQRSPALVAIRVHLAQEGAEPEPRVVANYLCALLRRPTDIGSFSQHVARHVMRRRGERLGRRSRALTPFTKPIPVEIIRSEVLLLDSMMRPAYEDSVFGLLVRALTPVPDGPVDESPVEHAAAVGRYDQILAKTQVDFGALEDALRAHVRDKKRQLEEADADFLIEIIKEHGEIGSFEPLLVTLYRLLLGRDPEDAGFRHHLSALEKGRTTPLALVTDFLRSVEFEQKQSEQGGRYGG